MINQQGIIGAAVGAALAATVLVTVSEGRVLLANERGRTAIAAGEQARARAGFAPEAASAARRPSVAEASHSPSWAEVPAPEATREELLGRDRVQRAELAALRTRLERIEVEHSSDGAKRPGETRKPGDSPFFAPTKEELGAMAKNCELKWDMPGIGANPWTLAPERAAELGLAEGERGEFNRVSSEWNARAVAELKKIYVDVTGDAAGAETLNPRVLQEEILDKSPEKEVKLVFQRLSQERAGLVPVQIDPRSPVERLMRFLTGMGDGFERDLGGAIGPDRARQSREDKNGWGSRHSSSVGCPEK
ncbi:MAG: hypothetical protein EXR72_00860 [Myxococcales bacterium]|nr:hypothetical protein [Myxococcales bacterium]